jgi:hypothetical protein
MANPLQPSPSLLSKLGSIAVHVDELLSPNGHAFDRIALESLINDREVRDWIRNMDEMAMLPKKR